MLVVEQSIIIEAPIEKVMEELNNVEAFPTWATVEGTIDNIQGQGQGMCYNWCYIADNVTFKGQSHVIEQTETTLITKTTGDVASLWTVTLTPIGNQLTNMQVVVEYNPPNRFIEVLADQVLERYATPEVASANLQGFKRAAEKRTSILSSKSLNYSHE